jgi:hypothetical protein
MKKFILILIASIIFTSCNAPTEIKITEISTSKTEGVTFTDFFNPVELVHADNDNASTAIVMDKNTGVLYVRKVSGYKWGMSPIYDSDGSVLTKEKWLAKYAAKKQGNGEK